MTRSTRGVGPKRPVLLTSVVAACALTLIATANGSAHAGPATAAKAAPAAAAPADNGAGWLAGELENGLMPNGFGGTDYGLTIDAGLALAEIGGNDAAVQSISSAMADNVNSYIGDPDSQQGGYIAKTAAFSVTVGDNPRAYGGVDLIARLQALTTDDGANRGRIGNTDPTSSNAINTLSQSFAALALTKAASSEADAATDFLLEQQCVAGYFRLNFSALDAAEQGCVGSDAANPDATALAVINLLALDSSAPEVTTAVNKATAWLKTQQQPSGAFAGDAFTPDLNSNSTGLAGWALAEAGETEAARKAGAWVRGLQVNVVTACGRPRLAGEVGAIAYNTGAFVQARTDGIEAFSRDQWRRASAQAIPALGFAPSTTTAPRVSAPTGYRKAGSSVSLQVSGGGCLTGVGVARALTTNGVQAVTLPAGTARRSYTLTNTAGRSVAAVSVLGKLRISAKLRKSRVERGRKAIVKISGLAAGEKVKVTWRGKKVYAGKVSSTGQRIVKVRLGRRLGTGKLKVSGQFQDIRNRSLNVKVTR